MTSYNLCSGDEVNMSCGSAEAMHEAFASLPHPGYKNTGFGTNSFKLHEQTGTSCCAVQQLVLPIVLALNEFVLESCIQGAGGKQLA